jgi:hypothetical protein
MTPIRSQLTQCEQFFGSRAGLCECCDLRGESIGVSSHSSWGISKAMGSARFIATATQLLLCATLCTAKSQGFQTTGKLVCILGPNVSTTSPGKNEKGAYRLVLEVKGYVYRCMEKRQGLLRWRRFRERDWALGRPVQVLVDEGRGEVYMQDQRKHRKEVVLQCAERVSRESWMTRRSKRVIDSMTMSAPYESKPRPAPRIKYLNKTSINIAATPPATTPSKR